jgi:hypothetical protein
MNKWKKCVNKKKNFLPVKICVRKKKIKAKEVRKIKPLPAME